MCGLIKMKAKLTFWFSTQAQASPYPRVNPARVPKNRSPPPRSLSRSASTTSEHNPTEVNSSYARSSNNRRSRLRTTSRKVHFPPEVDNEQVTGPKNNATSDVPATPESPAAQTTKIPQSGKRFLSQIPDTGPERATLRLTASGSTPTQRFSPEENAGLVEETSSGESEVPEDHMIDTVQTQLRSRREDNIRSGLKDLLEVNREAQMVDTNTATILESLLSQMNQDGHDRLVLLSSSVRTNNSAFRSRANLGSAGPSPSVGTGARYVECLDPVPLSLTAHKATNKAKRHPCQRGLSANSNLLRAKEKLSGGRVVQGVASRVHLTTSAMQSAIFTFTRTWPILQLRSGSAVSQMPGRGLCWITTTNIYPTVSSWDCRTPRSRIDDSNCGRTESPVGLRNRHVRRTSLGGKGGNDWSTPDPTLCTHTPVLFE